MSIVTIPDHAITGEAHERADNLLCKAQAVVHLLMASAKSGDSVSMANAAWAAFDMIEESRELYGKF